MSRERVLSIEEGHGYLILAVGEDAMIGQGHSGAQVLDVAANDKDALAIAQAAAIRGAYVRVVVCRVDCSMRLRELK